MTPKRASRDLALVQHQSLDFRSGWEQRDHYECRPMQFTGNPGPTGDFATLSAVEFFKLYYCQLVWDMLVDETNRYAQQTIDSNPDQQVSLAPNQRSRNDGICGTSHCYGHKQIISIQDVLVNV